MTTRRTLIQLLGAGLVAPLRAFAQADVKKKLVVVLFPGDADNDQRVAVPFFEEMRRMGWVEGMNIVYERLSGRGAREYVEGLAKIAADLEPQLIYATTGTLAAGAVKATGSIPVLFMTAADPVSTKLVASFAKPGRNATGMYLFRRDAVAKCLHLVREAFPGEKRIGVLFDRHNAESERQQAVYAEAAKSAGIQLAPGQFTYFEGVPKIFAGFRREGVRLVLMTPSFTLVAHRLEAAKFAELNKLAMISYRSDWAEAGALLTYGADGTESFRRCAVLANRILKGSRPQETPVEEVTKLELVVNLVTAKALGITVPRSIIARADRVIE
jgi:putative tryptophan/tyrosine transport system substrate-binding protein